LCIHIFATVTLKYSDPQIPNEDPFYSLTLLNFATRKILANCGFKIAVMATTDQRNTIKWEPKPIFIRVGLVPTMIMSFSTFKNKDYCRLRCDVECSGIYFRRI
jgi:hypothetical protein